MENLQPLIEQAFENRANLTPASAPPEVAAAVQEVLAELDAGRLRVAEKKDGAWVTHQWLKKAVLLSFRLRDNEIMQGGFTHYFDKVDSKFAHFSQADFAAGGYRVVPPATAPSTGGVSGGRSSSRRESPPTTGTTSIAEGRRSCHSTCTRTICSTPPPPSSPVCSMPTTATGSTTSCTSGRSSPCRTIFSTRGSG